MERPIQHAAQSAGRALHLLTHSPTLLGRLSTTAKTAGSMNHDSLIKALEHVGNTAPESITVDNSGITLYYSGIGLRGQRIGINLSIIQESRL